MCPRRPPLGEPSAHHRRIFCQLLVQGSEPGGCRYVNNASETYTFSFDDLFLPDATQEQVLSLLGCALANKPGCNSRAASVAMHGRHEHARCARVP